MRKGWKIFWIVCAVAAAIGLVCCIVAAELGVTADMISDRFPYGIGIVTKESKVVDYLSSDGVDITYAEDMQLSYAGVRNIDIDIFAGQVQVVASDEVEDIQVETKGINQKLGLKSFMEEDELHITSKKKLYHLNGLGVGTITIKIPRGMRLSEATMSITAGTLDIEEIQADELHIDVGAGEANVNKFDANEAGFGCKTGLIYAYGTAAHEVDADCGVGEINLTLTGRETDYNYEIDCGFGDITCGNSDYSGFGAEKSIHNGAAKEIHVDCGVGSVIVDFEEGL